MVKLILRLEGLSILLASLLIYHQFELSWILFIALFLAPDISMIGYLKDKNTGAITYNFVHNYILALVTILIGHTLNNALLTSLGLILSAHVGLDRFLEFGLKYKEDFKQTHFKKI